MAFFTEENQQTCTAKCGIIPNANQIENLSKTLKKLTQNPKNNITNFEDFRQIRTSKINLWIKEYGLRKAGHLAGHKNIGTTEKHKRGDIENLQNDFENFHPLK